MKEGNEGGDMGRIESDVEVYMGKRGGKKEKERKERKRKGRGRRR